MKKQHLLRSVGAVVVPATIFLSACPGQCTPAPPEVAQRADAPAAAGPPGGAFTAEFATSEDFFGRFVTHWGLLPDPRSLNVPAGQLTYPGSHAHPDSNGGVCGAPTTSRTVRVREAADQFYWCAPGGPDTGHIMTATRWGGYGHISFSPNQSFNNVSRICWDQNITNMGRQWTDVVIVPEGEFQSHYPRMDYASPGFRDRDNPGVSHPGEAALQPSDAVDMLTMAAGEVFWTDGYTPRVSNGGFQNPANMDQATRYTHCVVDNENGTVRVTQERPDGSISDNTWPGDLPDGVARVIFMDGDYDSTKDWGGPGSEPPFTWHWDNISVS